MITIIQQGTEAKFKVEIKDFDMRYDDFKVSLIYGYRRTVIEIPKQQMIVDTDDYSYYFIFDTANIVGQVTARCEWYVRDADYPDERQTNVDEQFLCFVAPNPCPKFICCPSCKEDGIVKYTLAEGHNFGDLYFVLADKEYTPIVTSDGENILVLKNKK